ncbi:hypothetical protein NOR_08211 [Metarhizium rileyi]|uniref:BZIP transcription factor n=1 Tax=Metarhizium rileyi (strain RCEF 4871) TaxID=1649241 RepID=A0A166WPZ7_METRR|nr:hypothetical protein NOR_08211 [Metarhizium rileyi RCEF 4871]
MASAGGSDVADSPGARSPGEGATPDAGAGGLAVTGMKRAPDGGTEYDEKAAGDGVKKKKTGPGSRGVANLTPEQLAKKRANDREAQRAIRERTKNQIEALERRIQELTNQKPYQELQAVVRAKEAVEQENADIKRQLAGIIGILKPIVSSATPGEAAVVSPLTRAPSQPTTTVPSPRFQQCNTTTPATSANVSPGLSDDLAGSSDGQQAGSYMAQLHNQRLQLRQGLDMGGERLGLDFLLRPGQRPSAVQAGVNGAQDSPQYHHVPMKHDWTASHGEHESHQSWTSSEAPGPPLESSGQTPETSPGSLTLLHTQQLRHSDPSCPLDSLLLNFLSERRQRIAEGVPVHEVIGPRYPSVSSLLNPSNSTYSHPLSRVFTDILSTFPGIARLPERVACLYVMFHLMRWQISPTRDNFDRIPGCLAPTQSQMDHAHPAWLDLIPFPAMRERLARTWDPRQYDLDNWFIPFTTSLRVSWPYEETDTLLLLPDTDEVVMNPVFERHIRNMDSWKLGQRFATAFPELAGTYPLDPLIDC